MQFRPLDPFEVYPTAAPSGLTFAAFQTLRVNEPIAGMRFLVGFLVFHLAFALRREDFGTELAQQGDFVTGTQEGPSAGAIQGGPHEVRWNGAVITAERRVRRPGAGDVPLAGTGLAAGIGAGPRVDSQAVAFLPGNAADKAGVENGVVHTRIVSPPRARRFEERGLERWAGETETPVEVLPSREFEPEPPTSAPDGATVGKPSAPGAAGAPNTPNAPNSDTAR